MLDVPAFDCAKRIAKLHKFGKRKPCGFDIASTVNRCALAHLEIIALSHNRIIKTCFDLYGDKVFGDLGSAFENVCSHRTQFEAHSTIDLDNSMDALSSLPDHHIASNCSFDKDREVPTKSIVRMI